MNQNLIGHKTLCSMTVSPLYMHFQAVNFPRCECAPVCQLSYHCRLVAQLCPPLLQPRGLQPVRLLWPWDFPGKNTGVGCHFFLRQEDPMPEGRWPRGLTPRPRSGAAAESARLRRCRNGPEQLPISKVRGGGREELPHVQGAVAVWA